MSGEVEVGKGREGRERRKGNGGKGMEEREGEEGSTIMQERQFICDMHLCVTRHVVCVCVCVCVVCLCMCVQDELTAQTS